MSVTVAVKRKSAVRIEKLRLKAVYHFFHRTKPIVLEASVLCKPRSVFVVVLVVVVVEVAVFGVVSVIGYACVRTCLVAALVDVPP